MSSQISRCGRRGYTILALHKNAPVPLLRRKYSVTRKTDSAIIIAGLGVVVCAATAQYALDIYQKNKERNASEQGAPTSNSDSDPASASSNQNASETKKSSSGVNNGPAGEAKEEPSFSFGSTWFAKSFYDGGFEDKMTRREAALILGIRESATVDRIKESYRKLLPLNHPDKGGSAYIATKINEAKDLLLKGK